jgi:succinate dehydrogenase / fumarate reductase cytochrome b subunit
MAEVTHHDSGADRPRRLLNLWRTTIGKKWLVAITGLILAGYVILHMLGNLKALQGAGGGEPALDKYAEWLRDAGGPVIPHDGLVWVTRGVVLTALVLHVYAILALTARNRAARPAGHAAVRTRGTLSARTMLWTGIAILVFVVFHILHFTTGTIDPTPIRSGAVYANAYGAFEEWWLLIIYLAAVSIVGLHLYHALWSATQTAGVDNPDRNWFWRKLATVTSVGVVVGFAIVPVLFFAGALPEPTPNTESAQR